MNPLHAHATARKSTLASSEALSWRIPRSVSLDSRKRFMLYQKHILFRRQIQQQAYQWTSHPQRTELVYRTTYQFIQSPDIVLNINNAFYHASSTTRSSISPSATKLHELRDSQKRSSKATSVSPYLLPQRRFRSPIWIGLRR